MRQLSSFWADLLLALVEFKCSPKALLNEAKRKQALENVYWAQHGRENWGRGRAEEDHLLPICKSSGSGARLPRR